MGGVKSTKVEIVRRIDIVYEMILDGWTASQIAQYIAKMKELPDGHPDKKQELMWGVKQRAVYEYYESALLKLNTMMLPTRDEQLSRAINRYEKWIRMAVASKDLRLAKQLQERLDKINGLEPQGNVNISFNNKFEPPPPLIFQITEDAAAMIESSKLIGNE